MSTPTLERNSVYADANQPGIFHRILWIDMQDEEAHRCVVIQIGDGMRMPTWVPASDVQSMIASGEWKISQNNPFRFAYRNLDDLPADTETRTEYLAIKERRQAVVSQMIKLGRDVFFPRLREKRIAELCRPPLGETTGALRPTTIRDALILFWQSGEVGAALYPRFNKRGRKPLAQRFLNADATVLVGKSGPKKTRKDDTGALGCALNAEMWNLLIKGAKEFLLVRSPRSIRHRRGLPFKAAHKDTLAKYFREKIGHAVDSTGRTIPMKGPWPREQRPTLTQFKTAALSDPDIAKRIIAIVGERAYKTQNRTLPGDYREMAEAPAAVYQIDWMLADVWLVSELTGLPVGRPFVYFVIDTFSRMVVGIYITLEYPTYRTAAMALLEAMSSKYDYARRYKIDLAAGKWDCEHVPDMVLHDGGELASRLADCIPGGVSDLATAAGYRPDHKAIVERSFEIAGFGHIEWLDGAVWKPGVEERPDPKKTSKLNLVQFTQQMIHFVVDRMNPRWVGKLAMAVESLNDGMDARPEDLWKLGLRRISGRPRKRTRAELLPLLLPRIEATVRHRRGLDVKCVIFYSADHQGLVNLMLEAGARPPGTKDPVKVMVAYDPNSTNEVYMIADDGVTFDRIPRSEVSKEYAHATFKEVAAQREQWVKKRDERITEIATREEEGQAKIEAVSKAAEQSIVNLHGSTKARNDAASGSTVAENKAIDVAVAQAREASANSGAEKPKDPGSPPRDAEATPPASEDQKDQPKQRLAGRFAALLEHAKKDITK